jgi:hypothetical protein
VFRGLRPKLTYANVIASLCLFLLVAGSGAYAASKLKANSVGTKQIKKNAVNGSKVADGSLSGADIGGSVDNARHATTADQLAGSAVQRIDFAATGCVSSSTAGCTADLLSLDGFTLRVGCAGAAGGDLAFLTNPAPAGVTFALEGVKSNPGGGTFVANGPAVNNQIVLALMSLNGTQSAGGTMIVRSPGHTKTFVFSAKETDSGGLADCQVFGNAVTA